MTRVRRDGLALAAAVAIAAAAATLAMTRAADADAGSPAATVRAFLITASVDQSGVGACRYLTRHAGVELAGVEPPDTSCEVALSTARLTIGGDNLDREARVKRLSYHVEQRRDLARVTVSARGAAQTFTLRKASPQELAEFGAPPTSWRVDSGVDALVAPATTPR